MRDAIFVNKVGEGSSCDNTETSSHLTNLAHIIVSTSAGHPTRVIPSFSLPMSVKRAGSRHGDKDKIKTNPTFST